MSGSPERERLVLQWVDKAEEDLRAAMRLLEDGPWAAVAFHAQQCAEKYLKALLVFKSVPFPKIHDIGELIQLLPPGSSPALSVPIQERLTYYATAGRYPADDEPLSRPEAEEAVAAAREVRGFVRERLGNRLA